MTTTHTHDTGTYLYGIIASPQYHNFGPIGIGERGDPVYTLPYQHLSAIVSHSPIVKYPVTRANSMAHATVLEHAMHTATILPVRFCTIAEHEDIIVSRVLKPRYHELLDLLHSMDGKHELGVRARWSNLPAIFAEILADNPDILACKDALLHEHNPQKYYAATIKIGHMVQNALQLKKKKEAANLLNTLRPLSLHCKENQFYGDMNLFNAAFLVTSAQETAFDLAIQQLDHHLGDRTQLRYIGPVVPYNFVEIVVSW